MYIPKYNVEPSEELQIQLIREFPLGTIITSSADGIIANHLPFLVDKTSDGLVLRAHFARVNHQRDDFRSGKELLVVFKGLDGYETPNWYVDTKPTTGKVVPTWDFSAVHVYGVPTVIEDPAWIYKQFTDLSNMNEREQSEPWTVDQAPESYVNLLQKAIWGLEIKVTRVESKWKVGQKLSDKDNRGVIEGFKTQGEKGAALSEVVEKAKIRHDERRKNGLQT
ncbi:hypothetical protein AWJ20_2042 [Sugiyamaella lignohabitans]|uniref:Transcriptional regulator n=1 Tax=Sugiyamaella lignohabitans TaxID=796027 RepID=A0A167EU07_9ASCO|nr:uncharacterized protein AWJ20_2042 [Sugiyamaella lignohabitans]ANB14452.1 hypothetical protein AWJ20_2042 [Sugiyamaella lignohabitans]